METVWAVRKACLFLLSHTHTSPGQGAFPHLVWGVIESLSLQEAVWIMWDWGEHPWLCTFLSFHSRGPSPSSADAQMQKHPWEPTIPAFHALCHKLDGPLHWPQVRHFADVSRPKVVKYKCVWVRQYQTLKVWAEDNRRGHFDMSHLVCVPSLPLQQSTLHHASDLHLAITRSTAFPKSLGQTCTFFSDMHEHWRVNPNRADVLDQPAILTCLFVGCRPTKLAAPRS